jgi:hypothetical protein
MLVSLLFRTIFAATSRFMAIANTGPGLLLSFTNIPEMQAESAAKALLRAIGDRVDRRR